MRRKRAVGPGLNLVSQWTYSAVRNGDPQRGMLTRPTTKSFGPIPLGYLGIPLVLGTEARTWNREKAIRISFHASAIGATAIG
jgi:hypothetical protein